MNDIKSNKNSLLDKLFTMLVLESIEYYNNGFPEPPSVCKQDMKQTLKDNDPIDDFIHECCDLSDSISEIYFKRLYNEYEGWCRFKSIPGTKVKVLTKRKMSKLLKRKFKSKKRGDLIFVGVKLKK